MVWVTTELPKRGQNNTSKKMFGQYKYFTYKNGIQLHLQRGEGKKPFKDGS